MRLRLAALAAVVGALLLYVRVDREGAAPALRAAQLESMRTFPHPFAWAGFTRTGAPR
jgi:CHAT domain-containing protein